jgi:hypothetical protein
MKNIYFFLMSSLIALNFSAQRIIPFVPNGNEYILDDSFEDLRCYDGLVFQDSLYVAVNYIDTTEQVALKVMVNNVLSDVQLDWNSSNGEVTDLLVFNNQLVAIGKRFDATINQEVACIGIKNGGQWEYFSFANYPRFKFGRVVDDRIYLFRNESSALVYFENGEFYNTDIVGVLDAEVVDHDLYFIKNDFSGMYHLDVNGIVHADSILCDTLNAFSVIDGQLMVSARCDNYLFRLGEDGSWVEDQLGIDFQGWKSSFLRNIFNTNHGFIAQFSSEYHNGNSLWNFGGTQSFELQKNSDLHATIVNVLQFEGRDWAICYNSDDGAYGGLSTIEDGWKYQGLKNEDLSVTAYSVFSSYPYFSLDYFEEPLNIGFQYKKNLLLYHSAFQIFGLQDGNLTGVGGIYPPTLNGAFCGPLSDVYSNEYMQKYNRVWKVSQAEIDYHLAHWWEPSYQAPIDILQWPGNGNLDNGETAVLAPFNDYNNNNLYEPLLGETPTIKGDVASFSLGSNGHAHSLPYYDNPIMPNSSMIEMSTMHYVFLNHPSKAVANTVFTDYRFISKESLSWSNVFCGFYEDFDIGTPTDDYIGCDTTRNLIFGYNGDDNDQISSGSYGYGNTPPACGLRFLNRNMHAAVYFYNSTNPILGQPQNANGVYQILQGNHLDGSPIINPLTQQPTKFMYSGEIGQSGVWNEANAGNVSSDRRMMASINIGDLIPNNPICITTATIAAQDSISSGSPSNNSVFLMKLYSDTIQTFFEMHLQSENCGQLVGIQESTQELTDIIAYPNPSNDVIHISSNENGINSIVAYDQMGQITMEESLQGKKLFDLNVQTWAIGIYALQIRFANNQVTTMRVVVN